MAATERSRLFFCLFSIDLLFVLKIFFEVCSFRLKLGFVF